MGSMSALARHSCPLVARTGSSAFSSTGTQHGGQETTITSFHTTLPRHGMIIVGLPYSFVLQALRQDVIEAVSLKMESGPTRATSVSSSRADLSEPTQGGQLITGTGAIAWGADAILLKPSTLSPAA